MTLRGSTDCIILGSSLDNPYTAKEENREQSRVNILLGITLAQQHRKTQAGPTIMVRLSAEGPRECEHYTGTSPAGVFEAQVFGCEDVDKEAISAENRQHIFPQSFPPKRGIPAADCDHFRRRCLCSSPDLRVFEYLLTVKERKSCKPLVSNC